MNKNKSKKEEARLKLIITAKELAKIAVEKEKIRLELFVTAKELAKAVVENKKNRLQLLKIAKHLARMVKEKKKKSFVLALAVNELGKITSEKEKIRLELFTTAKELDKAVVKRETYLKYFEIFSNALDAIFVADPVTRKIVDCNKAAETLTGYFRRELLSMRADKIHPKDKVAETMEIFKKQAKSKVKEAVESEVLTKSGGRVPVSITATSVRIDGQLYIQGTFRNIFNIKKTEEALRLKNVVFDSSISANSVADNKGNLTEVNKAFVNIWGYLKEQEVIGKSIASFFKDPKDAVKIITALNKIGYWEGDWVAKKKDGSTFIAHTSATSILDNKGRIVGYQSSVADITERKKTEEELKETLGLLNQAQHLAKIGSFSLDIIKNKATLSNELLNIYGFSKQDKVITNEKFLSIIDTADREKVAKNIAQAIKDKKRDSIVSEWTVITHKGVKKRIAGSGLIRYDNKNQPISFFGTSQDITDRKIMVDKLADSERKFRTMFENAAVGISLVGLDGKWLAVNPALGGIVGYSVKELLALDYMKLTVPEDIEKSKNSYKVLLAGGHDFVSFDKRYVHKKGYIIWVNLSISLVRDAGGKPLYFIVVTEDITDKKRLEKAKGQFVALTSHQLRTPPTAINWYSEMLLNNEAGALNEKQIKYVTEIHNGNQRMINLINSFLSVSQLQLGTIQVRPADTCIAKVTNSVLEELQVSVNFKKLNIVKKYDDTQTHIFKTDPNLIRIIIQNLISNAVSYTSSNGEISILIDTSRPNKLHLEVTDNGCGIPEEAKPKIFSEFYRADNAKSIKGDGSGLGLYITKSVIGLLGGEISFESKEGQGTTFFLDIPGRGITKK